MNCRDRDHRSGPCQTVVSRRWFMLAIVFKTQPVSKTALQPPGTFAASKWNGSFHPGAHSPSSLISSRFSNRTSPLSSALGKSRAKVVVVAGAPQHKVRVEANCPHVALGPVRSDDRMTPTLQQRLQSDRILYRGARESPGST